MEGRASLALAAFRVRVRCGSLGPAGVRDRGGRGREAAPSLRVRHLALFLPSRARRDYRAPVPRRAHRVEKVLVPLTLAAVSVLKKRKHNLGSPPESYSGFLTWFLVRFRGFLSPRARDGLGPSDLQP
ncbi:hypothetical protein NDU88_006677 [Pleurodeles waltl]|uniref:Uncharacterized protein n=1 Tax=Pleurodeles waltl TaxID=8319 RepID=A0AAV7QMH1_PLEWA|nr:hypothetical protein NDU88_006677 [Pleurodeles waltl]